MIAWGREKRNSAKVNYNERDLWEKSMKESSDESDERQKKTKKSAKNSKVTQSKRGKNSNSTSKRSNSRSSSTRRNNSRNQNKSDEYDQEVDDYYEEEDESDSRSETNSDYSANDSDEEEEENGEYSSESSDEGSAQMSIYHRRIKPVRFFEISGRKKKGKRGKNKKGSKKSKKSNKKGSGNKKRSITTTDYESDSEEEPEEDVVQVILGVRDNIEGDNQEKLIGNKEESAISTTTTTDDESPDIEYYVKFVDQSFQQCKWLTREQLFLYKGGEKAYRLFSLHMRHQNLSDLTPSLSIPHLLVNDETSINSDWYEIDRIFNDANEHNHKEYLVKWKSLEYSDSTWEFEENIKDKNKITEYKERLQHSNPKKFNTRYKRPSPDNFVELSEAPESKVNTKLRDYQLDGLNWLRNCWYNRKNNILADEMGLGKTAQIVCLLNDLNLNEGLSGPFLVVAPLSTLSHWKTEFERWTDMNCIVFHGNKESRKMIVDFEIDYFDDDGVLLKNRVGFDVMITNFETVRSESRIISSIQWRYLVVDEAHKMKNSKSVIFKQLKNLDWDHCTLLTGTPIQNDMSELWSLLNFVDPKHYNDLDSFMEKFGDMKNSSQVQEVQKIIKPILLRRLKGDVEKDILPKDETIIEVELTRTQKQFYKAFLNENASQLLQKITSNRSLPSLQNLMMQLRKVCNHPFLIVGAEKSTIDTMKGKPENSDLSKKEIKFKALIDSSGKMILIDKLLPKLKADGHKVLIFSQMVKILDILEDYLNYKGYIYERLDGGVSESDRQLSIERFNNDPDRFIFLLSTKAGGIGINLTAADTVIIYDSDWNPQNDIQAEARCHRIGQTNMVKVYRLITRDTYESEMFARASKKLALDHVVLDGGYLSDQPMKANEIEKILRNGAYSMFNESKDDDDAEIDKFCAADIDQILSSRSRRVQQDFVAGGGSVFSNVTFNATNDDLDLNSADFWSQVFPAGSGIESSAQLTGQRRRKDTYHLNLSQVRKMIQFIIENGYPPSLSENDNEVAHAVLQIAFSLSKPPGRNRNIEIITYYLRGHRYLKQNKSDDSDDDSNSDDSESENFDLEDPMKEYGGDVVYVIDEKSEKIVKRVIFFYRLRECLLRCQGNDFKWPEISPMWDSPLKEYALMLGIYRHGLSDVAQIFEDESLGLEHSKQLKKQQVENRVDQIMTKIELQFLSKMQSENENNENEQNENGDGDEGDLDDLPLVQIPDKFEPMPPFEWAKVHSSFFSKNLLTDKEVNSIIQVVLEFGIPIKFPDENEKPGADVDTADMIDPVRIIQLASPSLDSIQPEVVKSFIEKLLFVINRIDDDDDDEMDNDDETDNENSAKSSSLSKSKSVEIDLSDFPELQKLSATRIKHLKQSILIMSKIYSFIYSLKVHPDKKDVCSLDKPKLFPDWWSSECDNALIDSFAKYGQNFVYTMLADKSYPFQKHLKSDQVEIIDKNASQEKAKNRPVPFDEEALSDLKFLFSRRSRIPRVLSFIKHVKKKYERKAKEKHHRHSARPAKEESTKKRLYNTHSQTNRDGEENDAKREKYIKKEKKYGETVEEVAKNLRNPTDGCKLEHPADFYLSSRRLYQMKYQNAFGLEILVSKRNLRVVSFGQKRSEKQFSTKTASVSLNPGFVSFRRYPILASNVFEQRWYLCEIVEMNDRPFFRITDIDEPQISIGDESITKLFLRLFDFIRKRCLPTFQKKRNPNFQGGSEADIKAIYDSLDDKEQKVAPLSISPLKCYTIFGLNASNDDKEKGENDQEALDGESNNNKEEEKNDDNEGHQENKQSSKVKRSNANLTDGMLDLQFNIPLFDIKLFPQLSKDTHK